MGRGGPPGGIGRLVELIDRFGEALLVDFRVRYQLDLVDYFTGARPWWEFYVFLDALPSSGSAFREAYRNAPEIVEKVLALPEDGTVRWSPVGAEWTLHDELLASVFDRLGRLAAIEEARGSGKSVRLPEPFPRPVRAVDLARSQAEAQYLAELDDEVAEAQARWRAQQREEGTVDAER